MAVEDQPAAGRDRLVEDTVDAVRIDVAIDQGRRAQELEIDVPLLTPGRMPRAERKLLASCRLRETEARPYG